MGTTWGGARVAAGRKPRSLRDRASTNARLRQRYEDEEQDDETSLMLPLEPPSDLLPGELRRKNSADLLCLNGWAPG